MTPEALRHHIADRLELTDLLVDHVHALVLDDGPAGASATGLDGARRLLARHREIWSAHRPLIAAYGRGVLPGPAEEALEDRLATALQAAGLERHEARTTGRLLLQYSLASLYGGDESAVERRLDAIAARWPA